MLESVPKGVLEKPLPSLPEADDVAKIVKSMRRQFRFAVTDDDLLIVLQGIDDLFQKLESGEDEIRVRSFHLPYDQLLCVHYSEYGKAKLVANAELAELLATIARSSKGKRLEAFVNSSYLIDADRFASTSSKNLVAHLILERELVDSQIKRLRDVSLSTKHYGMIGGEVRLHFQSASRDRRARAYNSLISQLNKEKTEMLGQFLELHMLRRKICEKAGYKSFYEFATRRSGQTSTFRSNVHVFRLLVQEYVAPLVSHVHQLQWRRLGIEDPEPWDLMYPAEFGVPVLSRQAFPLEKTFIDASRYVCKAQVPEFEKMLDQGDLRTSVLSNSNDDSESSFFAAHSSGTRWLRAHDPGKNESYLLMDGIPQENAVNSIELHQTNIAKMFPQRKFLFAALLQATEGGSRIILKHRFHFRDLMEFDIYARQLLNRRSLQSIRIAPQFPSDNQFSELRAVIAEVIKALHVIPAVLIKIRDRLA
jgi:hypothetical protein